MKKYMILGSSIEKNIYPKIFKKIDKYLHQKNEYITSKIDLHDALLDFKQDKISGIIIENYHQNDVLNDLDNLSEKATMLSSVNTIVKRNNTIIGQNTLYNAFVELLIHYAITPTDKNFVIIGNNNQSKALQKVLCDFKAKDIFVVAEVSKTNNKVKFITRQAVKNLKEVYMIINTTYVGDYPALDESPLLFNELVSSKYALDLVYSVKKTTFLSMYEKKNTRIINGLYIQLVKLFKSKILWDDTPNIYSQKLINKIYEELKSEGI